MKIPTLYKWSIRRSGASMTIHHETGKVTEIISVSVTKNGRQVVAQAKNQDTYYLSVST